MARSRSNMPNVAFQEPLAYPFVLDGGLDLISSQMAKKPGAIIAGTGVEMVGGKQGYSRPGGYERCCDDTLPSETVVMFFEMSTPLGAGGITVGELFTSGSKKCRSLDAIPSPLGFDVIAVATHSTGWAAGDVLTGTDNVFTIGSIVTDTSGYTTAQLQAYTRQAIEQTRDNIPAVTGSGAIAGGFRLRGKNYVFREGKLLRGDAYAWTEIDMPQVMYFDEGVQEIDVGDVITDGTETATVASVTVQSGAWNYTYGAVDQANGYITTLDASGTFTADADLKLVTDGGIPTLTNGDFSSDTVWTKGTGCTIATGKAAWDGSQSADSNLTQPFVLDEGLSVTIGYTVSDRSAGTISPLVGTVKGTAVSADGTYSQTITAGAGVTVIGFSADADFVGKIDDVTVVFSQLPALLVGDFASDTIWTKGTGWTIGAGVATCSGAQTTTSDLSQAFTVADGQSVAVTFTITRSAGSVKLFLGASESASYDAAGTYTYVITRTSGDDDDDLIGFRADADFAGTVDNVSVAVGRLAKVKTANADYNLPADGDYKTRVYNFTNVADADSVFGVSGEKDAFEFDGTNYVPILHPDFTDTFPFDINIHQERLQLIFGGGQFVYSVSGQPRVYDSLLGAGSYSTGSEIVGSKKLHHNAEAIFCTKGIWLLLGTGVYNEDTATRDWQFVEHDSSLGASLGAIAEKGPSVFVSGVDFRTIVATDTAAEYTSNPVFRQAQPLLLDNKDKIVTALWCREKSQYRLFCNTGLAMFCTFEGGKPKGATSVTYPDVVRKVWSEIEDTVEKMWFVSDDGYLYRMDSGNTYDDDYITGSFRLPFYHYGSPRTLKQFPQMILELDSPLILTGDTEVTYTVNHSYGDPGYPRPVSETIDELDSAGGFYGSNAGYGNFVWDGPIVSEILGYLDGYGPNMSVLVTFKTKYDNPWTFISAIVDYIPLGIAGRER